MRVITGHFSEVAVTNSSAGCRKPGWLLISPRTSVRVVFLHLAAKVHFQYAVAKYYARSCNYARIKKALSLSLSLFIFGMSIEIERFYLINKYNFCNKI